MGKKANYLCEYCGARKDREGYCVKGCDDEDYSASSNYQRKLEPGISV